MARKINLRYVFIQQVSKIEICGAQCMITKLLRPIEMALLHLPNPCKWSDQIILRPYVEITNLKSSQKMISWKETNIELDQMFEHWQRNLEIVIIYIFF